MDKTRIREPRLSKSYLDGVIQFLDFAFANASLGGKIKCPCNRCNNGSWNNREVVYEHLVCDGFTSNYTRWIFHGEGTMSYSSFDDDQYAQKGAEFSDDMSSMLNDIFPFSSFDDAEGDLGHEPREGPNAETRKYFELMEEAKQPLYPNCEKFSKLSFLVQLLQLKCLHGWNGKSLTSLLILLKEAFPKDEKLPDTCYKAKQIIRDLGLGYHKIDACSNDCMSFWKDSIKYSTCSVCGASRWKDENDARNSTTNKKKTPAKVLRHFPLKPRFQQLFMSSKITSLMRWHEKGRTKNGVPRHPTDLLAWKSLDNQYPSFASDCRNVRLGLASDGFNPFGTMSSMHNTWPAVLMPYNLPSQLCMKQPYFIMSLLILGPYVSENDIDVYLQPLIDELKEPWKDRLETYDAITNQTFQIHAAVLWTISDFLAYANLLG